MGLKETTTHMRHLLEEIMHDLAKGQEGNKTASQRVRTNSIKFAKLAKMYRKESIAQEKKGGAKPKAVKTAKKTPAKKTAAKKAPVKKKR